MAVTSKAFGLFIDSLLSAEVNYLTATVKGMLVGAAWTPNQDTHQYKSSVTNEVTGTGYTAGGVTLVNKTQAYNTTTNTVTLDADDPLFSGVTVTFRYLVFYVSTGSNATSPLISWVDFGEDVSVTASNFTARLSDGGIAQISAA